MIFGRTTYCSVVGALAIITFSLDSGLCNQPIIVKNSKDGEWAKLGKSMHITTELSIGLEDGDQNYVFGTIVDIKVNSKGSFFVLDTGFTLVREYDSTGSYVRTIGRQGQGPGEFRYPSALAIDAADSLYVADIARVIVFNEVGEFVREISLPRTDGPISSLIVDSNQDIYFSGVSLVNHRVIHKYRARDAKIASFCEIYTEDAFVGESSKRAVERFYGGGSVAEDSRNGILFTRTVPYEIRRYSPQGELVGVFTREHSYPRLHGIVVSDATMFNPKKLEVAQSIAIVLLADGRFLNVIVLPLPPGHSAEERATTLDLFAQTGTLLTSTQLRRGSVFCGDSSGRLYGYDLTGHPKVVRYRITYEN